MKMLTPRKRFGRRLARMRQRAKLKQTDLSRVLQYSSAQFVSNWERGISYPPVEAMPVLARALKVPARELVNIAYAAKHAELYLERAAALREVRS